MHIFRLGLASTAILGLMLATACTVPDVYGRERQERHSQQSEQPQHRQETPPSSTSPSESSPLDPALVEQLQLIISEREDTYGVLVEHVPSGASFGHHQHRVFPSGSVYKLALAYEVLRRTDHGELSLHTLLTIEPSDAQEPEPAGGVVEHEQLTVRESLEAMMAVSSNASAHALLRHVGRANLNRSLAELGMLNTRVPVRVADSFWMDLLSREAALVPPVAETTPQDMALLLRLLARDELLSESSHQVLQALLALEEPRDPLMLTLPLHVRVLSKTGELEDATNLAGLIETPHGPVIVAVFSQQTGPGEAAEVIADIGRALYRHYFDQPSTG